MSIIFSFAGTHRGNLLKPFVTVLAKVKAVGKKREDFETNEGEWTGKVEIRTRTWQWAKHKLGEAQELTEGYYKRKGGGAI